MDAVYRLALLLTCAAALTAAKGPSMTMPQRPDEQGGSQTGDDTSLSAPLVIDSQPLLETLASEEDFSLTAVRNPTAEAAGTPSLDLYADQDVMLDGNMNCLIDYWEYQPFSTDLRYDQFDHHTREECRYNIGFEQFDPVVSELNQLVTTNGSVLVDGDVNTVWASRIEPGHDQTITVRLHKDYLVSGLDLLVESVPLDVTVALQWRDKPAYTVVRIKQKCDDYYDGDECEEFLLMERKYYAAVWDLEDFGNKPADCVIITLHGVTAYGDYSTNYHTIREIRFLAKPATKPKMKREELMKRFRTVQGYANAPQAWSSRSWSARSWGTSNDQA